MKKFWGIIGIPVAIGLIYGISYIFKFAFFLVQIDNTEFGFPLWLDIVIDIIAGVITYLFTLSLFNFSKRDKETISQVISIIVGFIIGLVVHFCLKYWYIVLGVVGLFLVLTLILFFKNKPKKVAKEQANESI